MRNERSRASNGRNRSGALLFGSGAGHCATLYHLRRPEEALQSIERALALDPDREVARTILATLRKHLQQQ